MWYIPIIAVGALLVGGLILLLLSLEVLGWLVMASLALLAGGAVFAVLTLADASPDEALILAGIVSLLVAVRLVTFAKPNFLRSSKHPPPGTREHYLWANRLGPYADKADGSD